MGVTIDNKLNWIQHIMEVKKGFVCKLNMLKRSRFLPKQSLLDLYFKVIFPSVIYALPVWDGFTCKDNFNSLERLHCRAARIIYRLAKDKLSTDVLKDAK